MALRDFDQAPLRRAAGCWLRFAAWRSRARDWIAAYGIKTRGEDAPIAQPVGRQRAARGAGARAGRRHQRADRGQPGVRPRLRGGGARSTRRILRCATRGGAVLLISEDLDELLELADRIVVMSEGRIVFETPAASADRACSARTWAAAQPWRAAERIDASRQPDADRARMRPCASPLRRSIRLRSSARTALVIIDMQRDFIEPGGFGAALGNDVALLAGDRARIAGACWRPGARAGGLVVHTREAHRAGPVRLPAGQAQPRQPDAAHRRRRADGPHPGRRRAGQPDHRRAGADARRDRRSTSRARARSMPTPLHETAAARAASRTWSSWA